VRRNNEDEGILQGGVHQRHETGLHSVPMLVNVFSCFASCAEEAVLNKPVSCFPFHCLFMRDGYDFDESLSKMDRIGGSFTHLENELSDHLKPFKGMHLTA